MNDQQLLCFLTVSRTLNFSAASRELFCTQPALSYQVRSLEKELGAELFRRSTTRVELTEAGRALLPRAQEAYRAVLLAHAALRPFVQQRRLSLRLPESLLRRDAIYPLLMERLHAALPDCALDVSAVRVAGSLHRLLAVEADAALYMPFTAVPPELDCMPLLRAECYLVVSPRHPLAGRAEAALDELMGLQIYYEPLYDEFVRLFEQKPLGGHIEPIHWTAVESYETVYASLLDGRCALFSPMRYDDYPESWYIPLRPNVPLPDVCLLTLHGDGRAVLAAAKAVFQQTYREVYPERAY